MNNYELHRRAAVRAYGNQFATGQYRVRLTYGTGSFTFAFRNPRTALRFLRRRTRNEVNHCGQPISGTIYRVDQNGQRQEFHGYANLAASMGDYSTCATVMIADMICN
jgi:hypothetical protein